MRSVEGFSQSSGSRRSRVGRENRVGLTIINRRMRHVKIGMTAVVAFCDETYHFFLPLRIVSRRKQPRDNPTLTARSLSSLLSSMMTRALLSSAAVPTAPLLATARRFGHAALQSEKPQAHWSFKVLRQAAPTKFFAHPSYVMAREKILSKMWREHVLLGANFYYTTAFLCIAFALKA
jgi:hypothetical protein